ncbi:radical SAM protein [Candidatus Venteria ishoeyi]|uniref:radical SAM/SPASM domain-containing protein n=1 Tax=Candidatus Venteria ishoeyi TaxID=1899563 RepID=UPI0025A53E64|nr:radical SAM/SPASM domain-containing protein [Candidatus Venteria ishoeyi]MDM8546050.1 radical SAM protein [Candidatus Venteria ishoeyi]
MNLTPIKYLQVETTTTCNQRCQFCPVSTSHRPKASLSLHDLEHILEDLKDQPLEAAWINGFNEPTYDRHLVEKVQRLHAAGIDIRLNSNASGLNPKLIQQLLAAGVRSFTINISSIDPQRYKEVRGSSNVEQVITHVEALLEQAQQQGNVEVVLLVLGQLDKQHAKDIQAITQHFSDTAQVSICPVADFAAGATDMLKLQIHHKKLHGCSGLRHVQWLHVTPSGQAILCCQDYAENYVVGNIHKQTPTEILHSEKFAQLRRWVEGEEDAPEDFICRSCVFAVGEEPYQEKMQFYFCSQCLLPEQLGFEKSCGHCVLQAYHPSLKSHLKS